MKEEVGASTEDIFYSKSEEININNVKQNISVVENLNCAIPIIDGVNDNFYSVEAANCQIQEPATDIQPNGDSDIHYVASSSLHVVLEENEGDEGQILSNSLGEASLDNDLNSWGDNNHSPTPSIISSTFNLVGAISSRLNIGRYLQGMLGDVRHTILASDSDTDINRRRNNVHFTSNRPYFRLIRAQRRLASKYLLGENRNSSSTHVFPQEENLNDDNNNEFLSDFDESETRRNIQDSIQNSPQFENESATLRNTENTRNAVLAYRRQRRRSAFDPFVSYFFVIYHFSVILILAVLLFILIYKCLSSSSLSFY